MPRRSIGKITKLATGVKGNGEVVDGGKGEDGSEGERNGTDVSVDDPNWVLDSPDLGLPIWFTTYYVQRGDDSMFRALSLLEDDNTHHHDQWREKIVEYVANHLMKDTRYHGKDCKVLTTTVGCNTDMVPILLNKKVCRISSLTKSDLSIIMDFLSETPEAYRKRRLGHGHNRGSYLELVAIGKILERHVVVFYPSGTSIRINNGGVEDLEQNTFYLVCVGENYHGCKFSKMKQIDAAAKLLLPSDLTMRRVKGDRNNMFRALAYLWNGSEYDHVILRNEVVNLVVKEWKNPDVTFVNDIQMDHKDETEVSYQTRMLPPESDWGDHPELVAAGMFMNRHIILLMHSQLQNDFLTEMHLKLPKPAQFEIFDYHPVYLLRVADGRFQPLERMLPCEEPKLEMLPCEDPKQVVVEDEPPHMETRRAKRIRLDIVN
jgi:hypothetical protein